MDGSRDLQIGALASSSLLLLLYNGIVYASGQTGMHIMLLTNPAWAQRHVSHSSAPEATLGIQTLRNAVLVSTFIGTLTFNQAVVSLNSALPGTSGPERARILLLALTLMLSFLQFALVIRCAAHIGMMIGAVSEIIAPPPAPAPKPASDAGAAAAAAVAVATSSAVVVNVAEAAAAATADAPSSPATGASTAADAPAPAAATLVIVAAADMPPAPPQKGSRISREEIERCVTKLVRIQAIHFSLGFRFLYCSLPFAFGAAGSEALIVASVLLCGWLYYIDHAHLAARMCCCHLPCIARCRARCRPLDDSFMR